jgi:hypothetical protein
MEDMFLFCIDFVWLRVHHIKEDARKVPAFDASV